MNRAIAALQNEQKDENLKFVSITVDPANDTPEVLGKYAQLSCRPATLDVFERPL